MHLTFNDFKTETIDGGQYKTIDGLSKMVICPLRKGYADVIEIKLDGSRSCAVAKMPILEAERIALALLNGAFDAQAQAAYEADLEAERQAYEADEELRFSSLQPSLF